MTYREKLSIELKREREKRGLSRRGLAKIAGLQPQEYCLYERGMGNMQAETLERILAALNCTITVNLSQDKQARSPTA